MKKILICAAGMGLTGTIPCSSANMGSSDLKPNIVFIYADDWGWGDLSAHGHPEFKTPHLDRLISEGVDFQQFNVLNPVCSASRAAVLTGNYPARWSVHQHFAGPDLNHERGMPDWLDPKASVLPKAMQSAGYRTAHFGKWHLTARPVSGAPTPDQYGFDEWEVFNGGADWPPAIGMHDVADRSARFIAEHKDHPFYLNVWIHESHTTHLPTAESMKQFAHLDPVQQVYAAVIADGDKAVGTVLNALKVAEIDDRTLVIFSSDNGPEITSTKESDKKKGSGYGTFYSVGSTGGYRGRKRSLFEGGVRVPFIVRWAGVIPAGKVNQSTVVTAVDLLPTFCALSGAVLPLEIEPDGENMLPAFLGQEQTRNEPIYWEWNGFGADPDWWPRLAVRDENWKLVMSADQSRMELYNLAKDQKESTDVAAEYPETVARLAKMVLDWKAALPATPDPDCCMPDAGSASTPVPLETPGARAPVPPEKTAKQAVRARAFLKRDANQDDVLTLDEYQAGLKKGQKNVEKRFNRFDTDGDGSLSREEFVNP